MDKQNTKKEKYVIIAGLILFIILVAGILFLIFHARDANSDQGICGDWRYDIGSSGFTTQVNLTLNEDGTYVIEKYKEHEIVFHVNGEWVFFKEEVRLFPEYSQLNSKNFPFMRFRYEDGVLISQDEFGEEAMFVQ